MKGYYQNFITDKSFEILKRLKKDFDFVLIGGWAVYFYTQALKSKDIDLIVDYSQLDKFKKIFDLRKNERLKKYEIKLEEVDIDIYLPYYSYLGLPVEEISKFTIVKEGFKLPKKEILLLTKLYAFSQRKESIKGEKDKIDIFSLLFLPNFDFEKLNFYLKNYRLLNSKEILLRLLKETKNIKELRLNQFLFSRKKREIEEKFKNN